MTEPIDPQDEQDPSKPITPITPGAADAPAIMSIQEQADIVVKKAQLRAIIADWKARIVSAQRQHVEVRAAYDAAIRRRDLIEQRLIATVLFELDRLITAYAADYHAWLTSLPPFWQGALAAVEQASADRAAFTHAASHAPRVESEPDEGA